MKLLIINLSLMEKFGDEYYARESWSQFPIKLATQVEQVTYLTPVKILENKELQPSSDQWKLELGKLKIEDFDLCYSFITFYKLWFRKRSIWRKRLDRLVRDHDVVIVRAPSPIVPMVARSARCNRKPLVFIFAGNLETCSDRILGNRGLKRLMYRGLGKIISFQDRRCSRHAQLIYIYTKELTKVFGENNPKVKFMQDPLLSLDDLENREDSCGSSEVSLLRVGRLIPTKGFEYLFEAMTLLLSRGVQVRLKIAGVEENGSGYHLKLEKMAEKLGIRGKVDFMGWIPYDKTNEIYCQNDIQVMSSLSEGVPRCIAEGAARGLPLVSTTAGGCADLLTHEKNALLVPPANSQALAEAIERVIKDGELRKKLIKEGYELARLSTFEVLGEKFLEEIQELV